MSKRFTSVFVQLVMLFLFTSYVSCGTSPSHGMTSASQDIASASASEGEIPIGLQRLLKAYPELLQSATRNTLQWKDGTEMIFDNGIEHKNFEALLDAPDLEDQMSIPYPPGRNYPVPPAKNFDPGRIRYEPFFLKMYGNSPREVRSKLVAVSWLPKTAPKRLMITSVNGVDKKLQAVSDELDALPDHFKRYLIEPAGTFNWRKVSGTNRLSPHSFGIAIDINTKQADYWKWKNPDPNEKQTYRNRIPMEIVEIFEKHGFIWGGKWYHYDTMHFEYRPELLTE